MERPKPLPPVQITIESRLPADAAANVRPGGPVDITITVVPWADVTEMRIRNMLSRGGELVSGDLEWSGPAKKGEERVLVLSVRLPKNGKGKISSRVDLYSGDVLLFTATADHDLGSKEKEKPQQPLGIRKDSKGRRVEEYR